MLKSILNEQNNFDIPTLYRNRVALILIIVNDSLIIVPQIATISFMVVNFAFHEKVLIKSYYTSKDLPTFKISAFLSRLEKYDQIIKNARKVKLCDWDFTSRTLLYVCSQNKWLLLIKLKSCTFHVWFVLKNIKMLKQNLKLNTHSNRSAQQKIISWWNEGKNIVSFLHDKR